MASQLVDPCDDVCYDDPMTKAFMAAWAEQTFQKMVESIVSSALYGMYFLSVMICIYFILDNSKSSSQIARSFLLGCISFGAVALTMNYIARCGDLVQSLQVNIVARFLNPPGPLPYLEVERVWTGVFSCITPIMLVFGDALTAWRACVIWPFSRYIKPIFILLMVANIAMHITYAIHGLQREVNFTPSFTSSFTFKLFTTNMCGAIISLAINIFATALIILKAWKHKNQIQELGFRYKRVTKVQQVLLLWIECGFLFCSVQALYTITVFIVSPAVQAALPSLAAGLRPFVYYATIWMSILIPIIAGLYPTAIYIMVVLGSSVIEEALSLQTITVASVQSPDTDSDGVEEQQELESVVHQQNLDFVSMVTYSVQPHSDQGACLQSAPERSDVL